jgi:translation initiation factor IF-3
MNQRVSNNIHERNGLVKQMRERPPTDELAKINYQIKAPKIRLIDDEGNMLGVFNTKEAIQKAEAAGLDLVEVSPNADPPVCKILDYGKYKYQAQKKKAEAKKNQKIVELKEIQISPTIDDNDYNVKLRNARRFIEDGNKVKVTLRFKGRQITHNEVGFAVITRFREDMEDIAKVDQAPKLEGKQIMMVLSPKA